MVVFTAKALVRCLIQNKPIGSFSGKYSIKKFNFALRETKSENLEPF